MDTKPTLNMSKVKSAVSCNFEIPKYVVLKEYEGKASANSTFYPSSFCVNGTSYTLLQSEIFDDSSWAQYEKSVSTVTVEI